MCLRNHLLFRSSILSDDDASLCCEILKVVFYLNMDLRRKQMYSLVSNISLLLVLLASVCISDLF